MITLLSIATLLFHRASHNCYDREGEIRLAGGPSSREGRVDICVDGYWYTPCQDTWGIEETRVVCRELGFCQQGIEAFVLVFEYLLCYIHIIQLMQ